MSPHNPHVTAKRVVDASWLPYAECLTGECEWTSPPNRSSLVNAKHHVSDRNHKVRVVWEKVAIYHRDDYDLANDRQEGGGS